MGYVFLGIAIVAEVAATTSLRLTTGENAKWWPWIIVVGGYVLAFAMLQQSLTAGVPLGVAYALWAGIGILLVAVLSWLIFRESLTPLQIAGMALILVGAVLLELGAPHKETAS